MDVTTSSHKKVSVYENWATTIIVAVPSERYKMDRHDQRFVRGLVTCELLYSLFMLLVVDVPLV